MTQTARAESGAAVSPLHAPSPIVALPLAAPDPRVGARVVPVAQVTAAEHRAMRRLLGEFYAAVTPRGFARDLAEKDWVVMLTDPATGELRGFSTLMALRAEVDAQPLVALYSGDTAFRREAWGGASAYVIGLAVRQMLAVAAAVAPVPAWWFVISSTYRSYRLVGQLFRDVDPAPGRPPEPHARRVMAELSRRKGFASYDPVRSVVRYAAPTLYRQPDEAAGLHASDDAAARFFREANPHAARGDRLASLVALRPDNLTAVGRRMLEMAAG